MKEKIIKILEKYDIDEYHWKLEIANEILAILSEKKVSKGYPEEFVKWFANQTKFIRIIINDNERWFIPIIGSTEELEYYTFSELYKFWLKEINKKGE